MSEDFQFARAEAGDPQGDVMQECAIGKGTGKGLR